MFVEANFLVSIQRYRGVVRRRILDSLSSQIDRDRSGEPTQVVDPLRSNEHLVTDPPVARVHNHVSNGPGFLIDQQPLYVTDGGVGHVQGLLVDEETWAIRYMVVDTSNWWIGHQVLIAPQWIHDLSWFAATVSVNLTRQAVKDAPPYDSAVPLDRNQEIGLHKHYKRTGYWADEVKLENPEFRVTRPASEGSIKKASDVATQDERFGR